MAQPAKFTFDTVFERGADGIVKRPPTRDELDALRAEGYAAGYTAGRDDALVQAEQQAAARLDALATATAGAVANLEAERSTLAEEACRLATVVARTLVPHLLARQPTAEIEAMLSEALTHLSNAPHLVVRVNEDWLADLKPRIEAIAEARGFTGKLVLLGEPDIEEPDCRIEWADGGIARDSAALGREIATLIARHFGADLAASFTDQGAASPAAPCPPDPGEHP